MQGISHHTKIIHAANNTTHKYRSKYIKLLFRSNTQHSIASCTSKKMAMMLCLPSEPLISDTAHRRAEENSQPFTKPRRRASRLQLRKTCPPRRTLPLALNRPTAPHHPAAQYKRPSSTRLLGGLLSIFLLLSILRLGPWGSWDSDPDPSPRPSRLGAPIEAAASGKILLHRFSVHMDLHFTSFTRCRF